MSSAPKLDLSPARLRRLAADIKRHGATLCFQQIGIAGVELADDERRLEDWLNRQRHGEMGYMARHGPIRSRPDRLVPGTVRVISGRMDYWAGDSRDAEAVLQVPYRAYISL